MIASCRVNIPVGKFRVACYNKFDHSNYIVKDCDTKDEAFQIADDHNHDRSNLEPNVYYVYDDKGRYCRGPEALRMLVTVKA